MMLLEFGFTDFTVNEHLIKKFDNVDVVADMLMNGQVSHETIQEIYANKK